MIRPNGIVWVGICFLFLSTGLDPVSAVTYYVSLSGNDKNEGTTPDKAWRTITYAAAQAEAGDTVHIRAGDYGPESVAIKNSGTAEKPIVLQGYRDKPGDIPAPDKIDPQGLIKPRQVDPGQMPLIKGRKGREAGVAVSLQSRKHVEIRNIGVASPPGSADPDVIYCAVHLQRSANITLDNVLISNVNAFGIYLEESQHCVVRNCCVIDGWANNIRLLRSDYNLLENCATYGIAKHPVVAPDYYIALSHSQDNILRNCLSHNTHPGAPLHPGHGIGLRDGHYENRKTRKKYLSPSSYNNKFINCVARNHGEHFYAAHQAHHNEFINCTAFSEWRTAAQRWNEGFNVRDGAHNNTFRNCKAAGAGYSLVFQDTVEGPTNPDGSPQSQITKNNSFVNCVFADAKVGFQFWNTQDNLFQNCIVSGVDTVLFRFTGKKNNRNMMSNTIVAGVRGDCMSFDPGGAGDVAFVYSDFWKNKFNTPSGMGNMEKDPLFADPENGDFRLKPGSPCRGAGKNGVDMGAYANTAETSNY